jgi:uncharacterized protein
MARDALVLGFPAFPLHSPDCAGLCPVCGADRNSVDCGHGGADTIDPRWAALASLRLENPEGFGEPQGGAPINKEEDDARPQA